MNGIPQCSLVKDRPGSSFWKLEVVLKMPLPMLYFSRSFLLNHVSVLWHIDRKLTSSGFLFTGALPLPSWWRARRASVGYVEHKRIYLLALGLGHKHHICQNVKSSEPGVDYAAVRMLQKIKRYLRDLRRIDMFWGMVSVTTMQQIHRIYHRVWTWCLSLQYNTYRSSMTDSKTHVQRHGVGIHRRHSRYKKNDNTDANLFDLRTLHSPL